MAESPFSEDIARTGYEWTCPYCGKSRLNTSTGETGRKNALNALQAHITASNETEHGPQHELPKTVEKLDLCEYVMRVGEEDRQHEGPTP